jgi:hypothetical protein
MLLRRLISLLLLQLLLPLLPPPRPLLPLFLLPQPLLLLQQWQWEAAEMAGADAALSQSKQR